MSDCVLNRAWAIAEQWLIDNRQRHGRIEISFGFCAEHGVATQTQREYMELCAAWTLDGGEPSALMANWSGE